MIEFAAVSFLSNQFAISWQLDTVGGLFASLFAGLIAVLSVVVLVQKKRLKERADALNSELRRTAELKRQHSELIENANDIIYAHDLNGAFISVNAAAERLIGYSRPEVFEMTIYDIVVPEHRDMVRRLIQRKRERETVTMYQLDVLSKKGTRITLEINSRPLMKNDHAIAIQGIARDITERVRQTERYVRTQKFLNSVVENLPIPVFIKDVDGLKFVMWNKAGEELIGCTRSQLVGKTALDCFTDEEAAAFSEHDREALENDAAVTTSEEFIRSFSKGLRVLITRRIPIRDESGRVTHLVGIAEDVTEVKVAEEELKFAKQNAERANRTKSEFLAMMSHEVRTPLNGVVGMVNLLLATELNKNQKEFAEMAKMSAETLISLIQDILDFAKIEAGRLRIESEPFDLGELFEGLRYMVQSMTSHKDIELVFDDPLAVGVPVALDGDSGRVRQVIMNLLGNAVKFTNNGRIALRVREERRQGQHVTLRFEVEDTGIGISPEDISRLFEPFSQADSSTTRKHEGTGLGLAICKEIVRLMQGEIGVESIEGKGSTFWFTIVVRVQSSTKPRVVEESEGPSTAAEAPNRGLRVLVAEDNLVNQKVAINQLENLGFDAVAVENGREALEKLRNDVFDIVLMDIHMPVMDGFEATRQIRQESSLKDIRVVAMTANALHGDREKCLNAGMDGYVSKPIDQDVLCSVLLGREPSVVADRIRTQSLDFGVGDVLNRKTIQKLRALNRMGGPDLLTEFVELFEKESPSYLKTIDDAIGSNDYRDVEHAAHTLKGSCRSLGVDRMGKLCADLERMASDEDLGNAILVAGMIRSEFQIAVTSLRRVVQEPEEAARH